MRPSKISFQIAMPLFYLFVLTAVYWPTIDTKADTTTYTVNIATSPSSGFLKAVDMAPGDKVTSILNVQNNGNLDFNYTVSAREENGAVDLYNKLTLKIFDSNGQLYEGSFGGLQDFPLGTIAKATSSNLTFIAELPKDTDNIYQAKSSSVAFDFTAVGHDEQISTDDCFEPPFSNNQFTLHQKSTVPIKFHLRNALGELETTERSNVRLEVTGPGVNGGDIKYVFAVTDGTLKFSENIDEPHYLARFSTFDYPVVTDATYTATVYVDNQAVCQKSFVVLDQGNRSNAP